MPDVVHDLSRSWNRAPAGVAFGTAGTGVYATLWAHDVDSVEEVEAPSDAAHYSVCTSAAAILVDTSVDGRPVQSGMMHPGDTNVVQPGKRCRALIRSRGSILHFHVPKALVSAKIAALDLSGSSDRIELICPGGRFDPGVHRIAREVLLEIHTGDPLSRLRIDVLGQDLVIQLLRRWSNLSTPDGILGEPVKGGLADWQVRRTTAYLTDNLEEDVSLEALADVVGLSTFHFARAFKLSTGLPPQAYQRRVRAGRAKELLASTEITIGEIATAVGYETSQGFARMFRAEVGASPSAYRRGRRS